MIKPFDSGEKVTANAVKERLRELIGAELEKVEKAVPENTKKRMTDSFTRLLREKKSLEALQAFEDPFGHPLVFEMADEDTVKISAKGKIKGDSKPPEPVTAKVPRARRAGAKAE
jgi:predicted component of type VI protein secretion system